MICSMMLACLGFLHFIFNLSIVHFRVNQFHNKYNKMRMNPEIFPLECRIERYVRKILGILVFQFSTAVVFQILESRIKNQKPRNSDDTANTNYTLITLGMLQVIVYSYTLYIVIYCVCCSRQATDYKRQGIVFAVQHKLYFDMLQIVVGSILCLVYGVWCMVQ